MIFQSANEINQNILLKQRITEMQAELDADILPPKASDDDAVLVEAGGPAQAQGGSKKKGKK